MKMKKKGFTLLELIVAITIASILGVIAFISYTSYVAKAHSAARKTDISSVERGLAILKTKTGKYPMPSNYEDITFQGNTAWHQGNLGEKTIRELEILSSGLIDPKYSVEYTYSITPNQKEYEIGYVDDIDGKLGYTAGDYNALFIIVKDTSNYYIITSPTIILSDIFSSTTTELTTMGDTNYVYSGYKSIPSSYKNSGAWENGDFTFPTGIVAFSGPLLPQNQTEVLDMMNSAKTSYENSSLSGTDEGDKIINSELGDLIEKGENILITIGGYPDSGHNFAAGGVESFTLNNQIGVELNSNIVSNSITVLGADTEGETISISNGEYSVNGGAFTSVSSKVYSGDLVQVALMSSNNHSETTTTSLNIGGVSDSFSVTTYDVLGTFTLNDKLDAVVNTDTYSNIISVTGGRPTGETISIVGGEYSINGGAYTSNIGSVVNGDSVQVKVKSSAINDTTVSSTLSIGGLNEDFRVTTVKLVDPFTFTDLTGVEQNTLTTSNNITVVGGSLTGESISILGGEYSINGGVYTSNTGTVFDGDTIIVRLTSGTSSLETVSSTLTVGNASDTFDVTTFEVTNQFTFTDQVEVSPSTLITSNTITIGGGRAAGESISISGGEYSINGGAYTSSAGTIFEGDTVSIRIMSPASNSQSAHASLNIDSVTDTFSVTTYASVEQFTFNDQINVDKNIYIESNSISMAGGRIAGENISISNGEYSINGGAYTSSNGVVYGGDSISVRVMSSSVNSQTTTAILSIGDTTDDFTVTTHAPISQFSFTDLNEVSTNTLITSNAITLSGGSLSGESISVAGGEYSINGGAFTSTSGIIYPGNSVRIRLTSSSSNGATVSGALNIGDITDTFSITTVKLVEAFTFTDVTEAELSTLTVSDSIDIIGGSVSGETISITSGQYSINNGAFTSLSGTVYHGDKVRVRLTSSNNNSTTLGANLTVGNASDTFNVTTFTEVSSFTFNEQIDVALNTQIESNEITLIGGRIAGENISITGGQYSVNGGAFKSTSSTITEGDKIKVQVLSSSSNNQSRLAKLTIGNKSSTFAVKTFAEVASFSFTDKIDVNRNHYITSNSITVSGGLTTGEAISISGGQYSINNGAFTSTPSTITAGSSVRVRVMSSGVSYESTSTTLTIGNKSDTFTVTTYEPVNSFSFTDQTEVNLNSYITSDSITISGGQTAGESISISGGQYSINNGAFTSSTGTIYPGNTVRVRVISSSLHGQTTQTNLNIGGTSDAFHVTTYTEVSNFVFNDVIEAELSTLTTSNSIYVSGGRSTGESISIIGGQYSINGGTFTSSSGTVFPGNSVRVRLTSSSNYNTTNSSTLNIGGTTDSFSVTTFTQVSQFTFTDQTGVVPNTYVESNTFTITGGRAAGENMTISGGEFSLNGGAYSGTLTSVKDGDTVKIRVLSSANYSTAASATLTIGSISDTLNVTTHSQINQFSFTDEVDVIPSTYIISNSITHSGGNPAGESISIVGGEYSINGGAYTSATGTIMPGDSCTVRVMSSASLLDTATATLDIGGTTGDFNVTTYEFPPIEVDMGSDESVACEWCQ